ncbi:hypothetical protein, partial [Faucicola boevrei]|uniref:hypothetical protein n=1 Tax=Faucicola boevrei TaxID=346665 RepID=UPI00058B2198
MKNIIVKTNTANKTLAQKVLQSKDSLVDKIQAQSNVNYELIDQTTGLAPKKVIAKRTGDDLLLSFEDSKQIDLILENYYQHNANILGLAEDGSYYQYFSNSHLLNELPQNLAQIQNLGANPTTSAWWATTTTSAINASISTGTILGVVGGISVAGVAVSAGKKNKVSKPVQPPKDETTKPAPTEEETKPPVAPKPPVETISP